jgi:hypothetical protein
LIKKSESSLAGQAAFNGGINNTQHHIACAGVKISSGIENKNLQSSEINELRAHEYSCNRHTGKLSGGVVPLWLEVLAVTAPRGHKLNPM